MRMPPLSAILVTVTNTPTPIPREQMRAGYSRRLPIVIVSIAVALASPFIALFAFMAGVIAAIGWGAASLTRLLDGTVVRLVRERDSPESAGADAAVFDQERLRVGREKQPKLPPGP
jgi:hypothetical protein